MEKKQTLAGQWWCTAPARAAASTLTADEEGVVKAKAAISAEQSALQSVYFVKETWASLWHGQHPGTS